MQHLGAFDVRSTTIPRQFFDNASAVDNQGGRRINLLRDAHGDAKSRKPGIATVPRRRICNSKGPGSASLRNYIPATMTGR